ncbi:MAG: DNA helicase RecQ [Phycisphaerae bacterium]
MAGVSAASSLSDVLDVVRRYWGFEELRPYQEGAIRAGLDHHDSLVVLPTGGGKSLCYQVPPALTGRTDIVVSPLISLMKDQVDALRACGYPAAAMHSGMTTEERRETDRGIAESRFRLIFVAPERLVTDWFLNLVERLNIRAFAIDEAHCISHWGHDFRPEYRQLSRLKERFPEASLHAFTATATERVRSDIIEQLKLKDPKVLVGSFDRPNLVYRAVRREDAHAQVLEVVRRHARQAVIVYCISRANTEEMADFLKAQGIRAAHYHAGCTPDVRRRTQEAFSKEQLDVVVATVAFGMGIDRSNVRCVVHSAMPKSVEHYQQETGRAGRDGLEAECILFYSQGDLMKWEFLINRSAEHLERPESVTRPAMERVDQMWRFSVSRRCRHHALLEYFGQAYEKDNCGSCDICLKETDGTVDGTETAQKILSCVYRVQERFGMGHVTDVLRGADTERIKSNRHDQLSTYGLMKGTDRKALTNLVYQLVDQGLLTRTRDEYPILKLNEDSWKVLRSECRVRFVEPKRRKVKRARGEVQSWVGVDRGLFDALHRLRSEIAERQGVAPDVIFGDLSLRDMARIRPANAGAFLSVHGVGEHKLAAWGGRFLERIATYCREHHIDTSVEGPPTKHVNPSKARRAAFELFAKGRSIDEVSAEVKRARSTTAQYLVEYIQAERPKSIEAWVDEATYRDVVAAIHEVGSEPLRPILDALEGAVPYDIIRLVARHWETRQASRV